MTAPLTGEPDTTAKSRAPKRGAASYVVIGLPVFCGFPALHRGDDDGAGGVAGDVDGGAAHVKDAVDAGDQRDALYRQTDALEHHGQHDHARAGDARGADGGQRGRQHDGEHLGRRR